MSTRIHLEDFGDAGNSPKCFIRTQLSTAIIGVLSQALLPRKPKGLVAAYEMLVVTSAIANLIRENKTYRINSSIQTGRKYGMQLLDDALFNLWKTGLCEERDVVVRSNHPGELKNKIGLAKKGLLEESEGEDDEDEADE
jgi:twitching motility protein PilT